MFLYYYFSCADILGIAIVFSSLYFSCVGVHSVMPYYNKMIDWLIDQLDRTGHVSVESTSTPAVPSDGHSTIIVMLNNCCKLLFCMWTFLFVRTNCCIWLLKIFTFMVPAVQLQTIIWQSRPTYKPTANNWKYSSHCLQLLCKRFKPSECKIAGPGEHRAHGGTFSTSRTLGI